MKQKKKSENKIPNASILDKKAKITELENKILDVSN